MNEAIVEWLQKEAAIQTPCGDELSAYRSEHQIKVSFEGHSPSSPCQLKNERLSQFGTTAASRILSRDPGFLQPVTGALSRACMAAGLWSCLAPV